MRHQIHPILRFALCSAVFALVFLAEVWLVIPLPSLIPTKIFSTENINTFLLISMGLGFLPVLILIAMIPVVLGLAFYAVYFLYLVALIPARLCWLLMSPRGHTEPSPRKRMLKRLNELKGMTPERDRRKPPSNPD
jgi:hypothetical protein